MIWGNIVHNVTIMDTSASTSIGINVGNADTSDSMICGNAVINALIICCTPLINAGNASITADITAGNADTSPLIRLVAPSMMAGNSFWELENRDDSAIYYPGMGVSQEERLEAGLTLCYEVEAEGAALLLNNGALPLANGAKVSTLSVNFSHSTKI